MKYFKAFALAFNMLTILPFFKVHHFYKGINAGSAMFYPLVGFIIGTILWGTHTLLAPYLPAPHLAVFIFALWVTITGALHLDGLSDTVDGLFVPKERALEVMKDSHVGGMGMTFTFVFLILKLSSIVYFDAFYLLPLILMLSRLNATLAIYFFNYVSGGVGALVKEELSIWHIIFASIFVGMVLVSYSLTILLVPSLLTLLLIGLSFQKRLGGLSGDIYGFIIEFTELVLLNVFILGVFS